MRFSLSLSLRPLLGILIVIAGLVAPIGTVQAQWNKEFGGYLSSVQSAQFAQFNQAWLSENMLHNRLNFDLSYGEMWKLDAQFRTRLIWGSRKEQLPDYSTYIIGDRGWMPLDVRIVDGYSALLHTKADRLSLTFRHNSLEVVLGRQRINWGRTYVWNANDVFNSYSFFDIDYIERPGSDALRLVYYTSSTSQVEIATRLNTDGQLSTVGNISFNAFAYDFQLIGGLLNEQEWVLGTGWAGDLGPIGFKGEISYLLPQAPHDSLLNQGLVGSIGLEYLFPNQLMLRTEYLYNELSPAANSLSLMLLRTNSLRNLSFARHNLFLGADFPISPLVRSSFSAMLMPDIRGFFLGPSATVSLTQNLELSFFAQYFSVQLEQQNRNGFFQGFLKLQQSF